MKTKLCVFLGLFIASNFMHVNIEKPTIIEPNEKLLAEASVQALELKEEIVYDGLTKQQLVDKINKFLNSDLKNKGELYVTYSLEKGVDPYLAVAISMHETGCKWNCSTLVKKCNNVGGQVGGPSCDGGSYKKYKTLDEGIKGFIDNIAKNYVQKGLTTAEEMNSKYAADKGWASKVDKYIDEIKES